MNDVMATVVVADAVLVAVMIGVVVEFCVLVVVLVVVQCGCAGHSRGRGRGCGCGHYGCCLLFSGRGCSSYIQHHGKRQRRTESMHLLFPCFMPDFIRRLAVGEPSTANGSLQ